MNGSGLSVADGFAGRCAGRPVAPLAADRLTGDPTILDLFDAQVAATPEASAMVFGTRQLSYRQLDRHARRLAGRLRSLGVGRDVPVAIRLDRSFEMLVAVLAVLQAGGAYLALDPSYPRERLAAILDDARPPIMLARAGRPNRFPNYRGRVLAIEPLGSGDDTEEAAEAAARPDGRALAYLIYTSGSTGTPKGVAMEHRPLFNLISWQRHNSAIEPGRRTLQFAPLAFDVSFQEIFATWCAGGTLVLVDERTRRDAAALLALLDEQQIDRLFLPYVALQGLAIAAAARNTVPRSLTEIIVAGETLRITSQIVRLFARLPGCTLVNQYGPSETHVVTAFALAGDPQDWPPLPPIGRPIDNVRVSIADESGRPIPEGEAGEIQIGGAALARGYLNSPELTAQKFIVDRHDKAALTGRLYRTGDLGRCRPDGMIEFLGRLDRQVKLRGFRIEPGEIEVVLAQYPRVGQAVVKLFEPAEGDKRLVAYVEAQPGVQPAIPELMRFLKTKLPPYMIPSQIALVDAIPLTPSGKIDLAGLPEPPAREPPEAACQMPPRNDVEARLATIWTRALKTRSVGATDNFFEIGGDSLLALRLAAEIEESFARTLPLGAIFSAPTIESLARVLGDDAETPSGFSVVPLSTAGTGPPIFLVHWIPRDLVRCLGSERPLYALSYGLAAQTTHDAMLLPGRVEDLAAHYAAEMRSIQPSGPYALVGYSAGGLVAYEMARQLRARGETVDFLGLIDTLIVSRFGGQHFPRLPLRRHIANFLRLPPVEIRLALKSSFVQWALRLWPGSMKAQAAEARLQRLLRESLWSAKLWTAYVPEPHSGEVTLFAAKEPWSSRWRYPAVAPAWRELTGGQVEIHEVVGRHTTIVRDPHARSLAAQLLACLEPRRQSGR